MKPDSLPKENNGLGLHHLVPKSRGGKDVPWNLKRVTRVRHACWHCLFGNQRPEEVIRTIVSDWSPKGYYDEVTVRINKKWR